MQLRQEIDTQRNLLAQVRSLRCQIIGYEDESALADADPILLNDPQDTESIVDAMSSPVEGEFQETTVKIAGATRTAVRRPKSLPSVQSLRGVSHVRREQVRRVPKPPRPVSIRRVREPRPLIIEPVVQVEPKTPAPQEPVVDVVEAPKVDAPKVEPQPPKAQSLKAKSPKAKPTVVEQPAKPFKPVEVRVVDPMPEAEVQVRLPFWVMLLLATMALPFAAGYSWLTIKELTASLVLTDLQYAVQSSQQDPRVIRSAMSHQVNSPLSRFDGRRDYLVAQALYRLDRENNEPIHRNLQRAIERSPVDVWNRLSLARLEDNQASALSSTSEQWNAVRRLANAEPAYWNQLARHWCSSGEAEQAVAAYRKLLLYRPQSTGEALRNLAASNVDLESSLRAVPDSAIASLQAATFLQDQKVSDWQERAELLLTKISKDITKRSAEDLAAEAELCLLVNRRDDAMKILRLALARRPDRDDWKLRLARLHYGAQEYDECEQLAVDVIRTAPGTELADQARLLREKIELVTGGRPISAN